MQWAAGSVLRPAVHVRSLTLNAEMGPTVGRADDQQYTVVEVVEPQQHRCVEIVRVAMLVSGRDVDGHADSPALVRARRAPTVGWALDKERGRRDLGGQHASAGPKPPADLRRWSDED